MKAIFTGLLLACASVVMGQSIECEQGTIVEKWEAIGATTIEVPLYITNISGSSVDINVERSVNSNIGGSTNYFCWGENCYPPATSESQNAQTIGVGETDQTFKAYLESADEGTFTATYTFVNANDIFDELEVAITINMTPTGVAEMTVEQRSVSIYPNPANDVVNFDYSQMQGLENPNVVVHDIVGNLIYIDRVDPFVKLNTVETSRFEDGYYIVSLVDNGKVLDTHRLVISH